MLTWQPLTRSFAGCAEPRSPAVRGGQRPALVPGQDGHGAGGRDWPPTIAASQLPMAPPVAVLAVLGWPRWPVERAARCSSRYRTGCRAQTAPGGRRMAGVPQSYPSTLPIRR